MKIFKTGYEIVKSTKLDELVMDREIYKNENINLKHMNKVLENEKIALAVLLDQSEQTVRVLNQ